MGIEPSAAVVAWGREHLRVELERGSIEVENAVYTGLFDAITMFDVIEHLPDPRRALQRCRRISRPAGSFLLRHPIPAPSSRGCLEGTGTTSI